MRTKNVASGAASEICMQTKGLADSEAFSGHNYLCSSVKFRPFVGDAFDGSIPNATSAI